MKQAAAVAWATHSGEFGPDDLVSWGDDDKAKAMGTLQEALDHHARQQARHALHLCRIRQN